MVAWPAAFPQLFEADGFSLEPVSGSTPIEVESGEPMSRRRFTGEMDNLQGTLPPVTFAIAQDIYEFWRDDLANGTSRFTFEHPLTSETVDVMFMAPPKFTPAGGLYWRVSVSLRTLP